MNIVPYAAPKHIEEGLSGQSSARPYRLDVTGGRQDNIRGGASGPEIGLLGLMPRVPIELI